MSEQLDRIESKLDTLIKLLDEFEPLITRYKNLAAMSPAKRVKEMLSNGRG